VSPVSIPKDCFLETQERVRRSGGRRWRSADGQRIWEWDYTHGHIEGYNSRGSHVGVFDAMTGERIGPAVRGRKIDV
jgi:hypothetical protein